MAARKPNSRQLAIRIAKACDDMKVTDVVILDIRKLTFLTDFFVIGTTVSDRQSRAVSEEIRMSLKTSGVKLMGSEGLREGKWALLDYADVVCHLFGEEQREFYDLDSLWGDAPKIAWKPKRPARKKKAN